jgi:hypothetical protein
VPIASNGNGVAVVPEFGRGVQHPLAPSPRSFGQRRLPILFVSGYMATGGPEPFDKRPLLHKPFQIEQLKHALEGALKSR